MHTTISSEQVLTMIARQSIKHLIFVRVDATTPGASETDLILGKHKRWVQTWLRMNPNCEHKLWTDAQLEELARTKSPDAGNALGGWGCDVGPGGMVDGWQYWDSGIKSLSSQ